ncbi:MULTISPECIES: MarR family winged helix-turn-helix transcriptional regulator [unclassified Streptomyces]|uniref:MarR family winged helix-turn-helix transcriptional regulator n=1 Tax=unclassified Streptomyces TaxID=2593676 RepID=UPI0009A11A84|nr:MarR family winged helix-turn-helix transcriptional regulator [Streptomyces sp. CB02400]
MNNATSNEPAPLPGELAARLRAVVGTLVRSARTVDRLASVPAAVLGLLDTGGPMTTADLAAARGVRHQTMAATVRELTDAGFLAVHPDPDDARRKVLTLTGEGKETLDADRRQRVGVLTDALEETLDEEDRRALAHALDLIERISGSIRGGRSFAGEREFNTGSW